MSEHKRIICNSVNSSIVQQAWADAKLAQASKQQRQQTLQHQRGLPSRVGSSDQVEAALLCITAALASQLCRPMDACLLQLCPLLPQSQAVGVSRCGGCR